MSEAFTLYLIALASLAFGATRIMGLALGALFVYRYPLAAMMVGITVLVGLHLFLNWRKKHESQIGRRPLRSRR